MKETTEEYIARLKAGLATLETALYEVKMSAQEVNTRKNKQIAEQQAEIEALKELNTMLKDAIEKRIGMDAERYKWLRAEFAAGRETYIGEWMPSGEDLDKYIDGKAQEK